MEIKEDRRKHPRFKVNRRLVVTLKTESEAKLCIITDISRGGLAFRYLNDGKQEVCQNNTLCMLTLCEADGKVLIANIPARIVHDCQSPEELFFSLVQMRRCCAQFRAMSPEQRSKLDIIIMGAILRESYKPDIARSESEKLSCPQSITDEF
jgi:hypothetical protein